MDTGSSRWWSPPAIALTTLLIALSLIAGCGSDRNDRSATAENTLSLDVDERLTDTTYALVNQDSTAVPFPDRFLGRPVLLGTIYTNCPSVCPKITANMTAIRERLDEPDRVHFVSITFDPQRDTPSRLAEYAERFEVDDTSWQFLTGDSTTIAQVMNRLDVRYRVKDSRSGNGAPDTTDGYIFAHSNQITLIDAQGRVRAEYAGSQTPPNLILNDLDQIREDADE